MLQSIGVHALGNRHVATQMNMSNNFSKFIDYYWIATTQPKVDNSLVQDVHTVYMIEQ